MWRGTGGHDSIILIDNLHPIEQVASRLNEQLLGGTVTILKDNNYSVNGGLITIQIIGTLKEYIKFAKNKIMKSYNHQVYKCIEFNATHIQKLIDNELQVSSQFFKMVDDLSMKYEVEYIMQNDGMLTIYGNQDTITVMESQIRILINTLLEDLYVDSVDIELSTLPLIGGVDLFNFNQIASQLNCNIYVPDLLPELFNSNVLSSTSNLPIYITTKSIPSMLLTKKLVEDIQNSVLQVGQNEAKPFVIKEIPVSKEKLELITLSNQHDLLRIMFKNEVFIQVPSLGELDDIDENNTETIIKVQGSNIDSVNDAINDFSLLCGLYMKVTIDTNSFDHSHLFQICRTTTMKTCFINSNDNLVEIIGMEKDVINAVQGLIGTLPLNHNSIKSATLSLELNVTQRDFISGKKNGKILKVLNQLDYTNQSIVKFEPLNEYNFLINLVVNRGEAELTNGNASPVLSLLLRGINLIKLELPAELTFNIPEVFHKSIIGNGGAIIQSIMKKYNVFIKFSSKNDKFSKDSEKAPSHMQYSLKRNHNVLIKCPNKNAKNIGLVKYEVDELVYQCCAKNIISYPNSTTYLTTHFKILKHQYSMLLNAGTKSDCKKSLASILEIEQSTNTFIDFPKSLNDFGESEELTFKIKGADIKSKQAAIKLAELLPKCYRLKISQLPGKFADLILNLATNSDFVNNIVYPFQLMLGCEISLFLEGSSRIEQPAYHLMLIHYWDENNDEVSKEGDEQEEKQQKTKIDRAVSELKNYLRLKNFLILDKENYEYDGIVDTPDYQPSQYVSPIKKLKLITNTHIENSKANQSKNHNQKKKYRKNMARNTNNSQAAAK